MHAFLQNDGYVQKQLGTFLKQLMEDADNKQTYGICNRLSEATALITDSNEKT